MNEISSCHDSYAYLEPELTTPTRPVVVGVDGSANSIAALRRAAVEAARLTAPLTVVFAYHRPLMGSPYGVPAHDGMAFARQADAAARKVLAESVTAAFGSARPPNMTLVTATGPAAHVLTTMSADAEMLVVGARGHGATFHLLLGSTSEKCAQHATCPVLIVPTPADRTEPVASPDAAALVG